MKTFMIDASNQIAVHSGDVEIADDAVTFTTEAEFAESISAWPGARLIEVWNNLPGATAIAKFKDRKTAARRIWAAMEKMEPTPSLKSATAPAKKTAGKKAAAESKTDQVLAALRSPNGVSLVQLMKLTGWQAHSVRGFLSAQVDKRMGLRVKSFKRDGERCYKIRG